MSDANPDQSPASSQTTPPPAPPPPPAAEPPAPRPLYLRTPAIVLFVLGILIIVGGIAKFIPGGGGTGGALAFWGVLLFALSFIRLPKPSPDPPPMSAMERLAGVFYEPTRVFKNLRAHPRWLAAFLLVAILSIGYAVAFQHRLTPERIVSYTADKMAETPFIPPEAVERAREDGLEQAKNPVQRVGTAIKSTVGIFVFMTALGALYMLGVLVFGGRINFWQSFAALLHASVPIVVIQKVISLVLLFIKSPDDIHPIMGQETLVQDNLGVLFTPADHPVLFVTASAIGLLSFYGLWLKATALLNAGTKVSKGAAWGTAILFWLLGLLFIVSITALFPSFIS
ncbi:MAG: YIP1 family protein [Acidobacteriota bacterium]